MNTKRCRQCEKEKPVEDFYPRDNKCKPCRCVLVNARRVRLESTDPAWVESEATRHRIKSRNYRAQGRVTVAPAKMRAARKNWETLHPLQKKANCVVNNAVRDGRLIKQPCEKCGNPEAQAHHEDYSKPLEVNWLCVTHHAARHVEINSERRLARFATRSE